jgi:hypothetical protein
MSLLLLVHPPPILRVFSYTTSEEAIAGHFSKDQYFRVRAPLITRSRRSRDLYLAVNGLCSRKLLAVIPTGAIGLLFQLTDWGQ